MKKHFSFIKYSWLWFSISLIAILIGIGAMVNNTLNNGQAIKLGIDFTGGTLFEVQFNDLNITKESLNEVIEGFQKDLVAQINQSDQGSFIVQSKALTGEKYDQVKLSMEKELGEFTEIRFNNIGPKIGETLRQKAIIALSIALIAIVLYIAYAFRKVPKRVSAWRFGFTAIVALVHDVLITLGVFALLGFEVDALFITALLTIMGFSVHDTIVVFDRIRENLRKQSRNDTFGDVADKSLHETLWRSINTSVSTLVTLAALYFLGAESIRVFVFALMVGIIAGTYSSIFIASPVLSYWQERKRVR